ncbi:MAG: translation initiation factor [Prevotellaceae bacterium]|jgi:translation initiation factor 1|nr:translation initiation factor [Prevotellaceae bacterium]
MDWKDKLDLLYDSNPELDRNDRFEEVKDVKKTGKQQLRIELDKRNGKPATIISGFEESDEELKELARALKIKCGSGGSARGGEILIQGDFRKKTADFLLETGYKVKKINFS